jgi:hypothetical protein
VGVSVIIPRRLAEEVAKRGLVLEEIVLSSLIEKLGLDPAAAIEARLELARRYLREGVSLRIEILFRLARSSIKLLRSV